MLDISMRREIGGNGFCEPWPAALQNSTFFMDFGANADLPNWNCRGCKDMRNRPQSEPAMPLINNINWIFLAKWPIHFSWLGKQDWDRRSMHATTYPWRCWSFWRRDGSGPMRAFGRCAARADIS